MGTLQVTSYKKGGITQFSDYLYFCRLDIVQILLYTLNFISISNLYFIISERFQFFISSLNNFYLIKKKLDSPLLCLSTTLFLLYVINKKGSFDTSENRHQD